MSRLLLEELQESVAVEKERGPSPSTGILLPIQEKPIPEGGFSGKRRRTPRAQDHPPGG